MVALVQKTAPKTQEAKKKKGSAPQNSAPQILSAHYSNEGEGKNGETPGPAILAMCQLVLRKATGVVWSGVGQESSH